MASKLIYLLMECGALETKNLTVFGCFQGLEKVCFGNESINLQKYSNNFNLFPDSSVILCQKTVKP